MASPIAKAVTASSASGLFVVAWIVSSSRDNGMAARQPSSHGLGKRTNEPGRSRLARPARSVHGHTPQAVGCRDRDA